MRSIKKRLVVKNDGFAKSKKPANERIDLVINRYLEKMSNKGWIPSSRISAGNAFFVYECYVRMVKPSTEKDIQYYEKNAIDDVFVKENGVWKTS